MKKLLILMMTILLCLPMFAQNYENDGKPYYFYCQISGSFNLGGKLRLSILWKDKEENELRNEKGEKIEFKNMIEIINYMSKRGWEYVESNPSTNSLSYLFKKQVTKDEDAHKGIYFKSDFNK